MVKRQRRDLQPLQIKHHKRLHRVAEIKQARMFKQIVAALLIRWTVDRDCVAHAPAQREQPLDVIHMVVRQQKLLERSGRPAIGEIVQPGVDQGDRVVKLHDAAAWLAAILRRASRSGAGRALAAPCRNALCAASAGEREGQAHVTAPW